MLLSIEQLLIYQFSQASLAQNALLWSSMKKLALKANEVRKSQLSSGGLPPEAGLDAITLDNHLRENQKAISGPSKVPSLSGNMVDSMTIDSMIASQMARSASTVSEVQSNGNIHSATLDLSTITEQNVNEMDALNTNWESWLNLVGDVDMELNPDVSQYPGLADPWW